MVKIKEGYVMTPREQAEFDRVNAMPRKTGGMVAYYYKPEKKYPARIYVFKHAEIWQDRNRRPMGLYGAESFLKRPMNSEEIEYHHFDTRLCYHQYEDWDKLIYAEEFEAEQLDKENSGTGTVFLEKLKSFRPMYPVGGVVKAKQPKPEGTPVDPTTALMQELITNGGKYAAAELAEMMREEQEGENRTAIMILLRELYRFSAGEELAQPLTPELITHKAIVSDNRRRRNFVRRCHQRSPLFALAEIRTRYPDYTEEQLLQDLTRKSKKQKSAKRKPVLDFRRCQLAKLANLIKFEDDAKAYQTACNTFVMLEQAHRLRLPIPLLVNREGIRKVYYFRWQTNERDIKDFVAAANQQGQTHDGLGEKFGKIILGIGEM